MADHTTAGIDLDKLEALVREYGNTPVLSIGRGRSDILAEIKELARRSTSESNKMWAQEELDRAERSIDLMQSDEASGSDGTAAAELPPLPRNYGRFNINGPDEHRIRGWTSEQMQDYGRACYAIGRGAAVRDYISPTTSGSELAGNRALAPGSDLNLEAALDREYPLPNSPHASVNDRACNNRAAFERGWYAALAQQAGAPVDSTCKFCDGEGVVRTDELDIAPCRACQIVDDDEDDAAAPASAAQDERDAKDAARYRWLRDVCPEFEAMASPWLYDDLDKAIDAAMSQSQGQQSGGSDQ